MLLYLLHSSVIQVCVHSPVIIYLLHSSVIQSDPSPQVFSFSQVMSPAL